MKFSVLMSVYVREKPEYLTIAMQSIFDQTLKTDDFVLVCDGPLNADLDGVIKEMARTHSELHVIRLEKNVGLGNALNIGLTHCKYDYVARMDSDDFSLPERFEKQVNYLQEHTDLDILGGQIIEYDSSMTKELAVRKVPLTMPKIVERMKRRNAVNHVTVMYRKNAVVAVGNYQHCPYFEDYFLWCRMINAGYKFCNLDNVLVKVRAGDTMYKRRGGKIYNEAIIGFQKKIFKLGFINRLQYWLNLIIRLSVANMPNFFRGGFYRVLLRAKK